MFDPRDIPDHPAIPAMIIIITNIDNNHDQYIYSHPSHVVPSSMDNHPAPNDAVEPVQGKLSKNWRKYSFNRLGHVHIQQFADDIDIETCESVILMTATPSSPASMFPRSPTCR